MPESGSQRRYRLSERGRATAARADAKFGQTAKGKLKYLKQELRIRAGITLEEYRRMEALQMGLCFLCHQPPTGGARADARLCVDHDHATNRVRGLLCNRCNRALGLFFDDPRLLRAAADYIERYQ